VVRTYPPPRPTPAALPRLVRGVRAKGWVIFGTSADGRSTSRAAAVTEVLLAKGREALLLGNGVDIRADDEGYEVEEWYPGVLGQELLGEGEADRRGDPAYAHDLPETNPHRRPYLVECPCTGNEGHCDEVDRVLDGCNLVLRVNMWF